MAEEIKGSEIGGETEIADEVIAAIAGVAARDVDGVANLGRSNVRRLVERLRGGEERAKFGVSVEVGKTEAIVDLDLDIIYGFNIPKMVREVRKKVAVTLLDIAGLVAKEINVHVVRIEFPEQKQKKSVA